VWTVAEPRVNPSGWSPTNRKTARNWLCEFLLYNNYRLIYLRDHETSPHDEIAGQILWLDLAALRGKP
jgi:hypothetical protein